MRRLCVTVGTASAAGLLAACSGLLPVHTGSSSEQSQQPAGDARPRAADEQMSSAPASQAAWLRAVDDAYARSGGVTAEEWLRNRMAHRRPGERLAVVMGIDDVVLQTHFVGIDALVPRSVRFAQAAHALGYSVFYVTGRSASNGLARVEATLQRANLPMNAVYGRPVGAVDVESAKAQCRAAIKQQGYTLAMVVAASEASFDGAPEPETEIRLPDFAERG
jgi:hypothetical protein